MPAEKDERISRSHIIHAERASQIGLNLLAITGGRPYIAARLSRLPFESEASWSGHRTMAAGVSGGREDRAFLINYAGRIATKINQYVFSTEVQRQGADSRFLADATRTGTTISALMLQVSEIITAARWCWISVDRNSLPRDVDGNPIPRSVAAKEASGDRVYWSVWTPNEVVDWHFDSSGKLEWVITEQSIYDNADFATPAASRPLRTIWQRGGGIRLWLKPDKPSEIEKEEIFTTTLDEVGFVPVGTPSSEAWWFDDVEAVQASLLNLDSVHGENLFQTVFPQLILPDGMLQTLMDTLKISGEAVLEMVRGLNYPIFEPLEANGQTRYLMPNTGEMKAIPDEIMRRRKELFEIVGLAMTNPTGQIASAESKSWDHLDPEAVLKERAILLEESETKAVKMSKRLDSTFAEYTPIYSQSFDVKNISEQIATIINIGQLDLPWSAKQELKKAGLEILTRVIKIPEARKTQIIKEIDAQEEAVAIDPTAETEI